MAEGDSSKQRSVDFHAAQIVFLCNANRACIIWQALLDKKMEASPSQLQTLSRLMKNALSLQDGVAEQLKQLFYLHCAGCVGFVELVVNIAWSIIQGNTQWAIRFK